MAPLVSVGPRHVLNVRLRDLQPEGGVPDHFGALYWGQTWALSLGMGGALQVALPQPVGGGTCTTWSGHLGAWRLGLEASRAPLQ